MFNFVAIFGCLLSIVLQFFIMCLGRFLFGFAAGVFIVATPRILEETVPGHVMDNGYGISTNIAINLSVATSFILGLGMPNNEADLATTGFWRMIYLFPVPVCGLALFMNY